MEIEGKIIMDIPMEDGISKAGKPWKKKGWVLETFGMYPNQVKFDVFGDKTATLTFEVNKCYAVSLDAQSREFNGRWYTDLRAYGSREIAAPTAGQQPQQPYAGYAPQTPAQGPQFSAPQGQGPVFGQPQGMPAMPEADPTEDLPF